MKKFKFNFCLLSLLFASSFLNLHAANKINKLSKSELGINTLEYAKTAEQRAKGLMQRTKLCQACAMLFIYDAPVKDSFWMKDTIISLDIMFMDKDGKVVALSESTEPLNPTILYKSPTEYQYALETNAGFAKRAHIKLGTYLDIPSLLNSN